MKTAGKSWEIYFTVDVGIRQLDEGTGTYNIKGALETALEISRPADSHPLSAADGQVRGEYPVLLGGVGGAHFTAAHLGTAGLFRLIICGPPRTRQKGNQDGQTCFN